MRKAHQHLRNGDRNVLVAESVRIVGNIKRAGIMPGALEGVLHAKRKKDFCEETFPTDASDFHDIELGGEGSFEHRHTIPTEISNLDPFEPRFYYLLSEYLRYRREERIHVDLHPQRIVASKQVQCYNV